MALSPTRWGSVIPFADNVRLYAASPSLHCKSFTSKHLFSTPQPKFDHAFRVCRRFIGFTVCQRFSIPSHLCVRLADNHAFRSSNGHQRLSPRRKHHLPAKRTFKALSSGSNRTGSGQFAEPVCFISSCSRNDTNLLLDYSTTRLSDPC